MFLQALDGSGFLLSGSTSNRTRRVLPGSSNLKCGLRYKTLPHATVCRESFGTFPFREMQLGALGQGRIRRLGQPLDNLVRLCATRRANREIVAKSRLRASRGDAISPNYPYADQRRIFLKGSLRCRTRRVSCGSPNFQIRQPATSQCGAN